MSDQNIIKDWKAYFAAFGPREPFTGTHIQPMYAGPVSISIVYVKGIDLERLSFSLMEDNLLDTAKEVYEAQEGPEMWVFINAGGPPWHMDARPKPVNKPGRKG